MYFHFLLLGDTDDVDEVTLYTKQMISLRKIWYIVIHILKYAKELASHQSGTTLNTAYTIVIINTNNTKIEVQI